MKIPNISSYKDHFYTHTMYFKGRWVDYRPSKSGRNVVFEFENETFVTECNPLIIEDDITKYLLENVEDK